MKKNQTNFFCLFQSDQMSQEERLRSAASLRTPSNLKSIALAGLLLGSGAGASLPSSAASSNLVCSANQCTYKTGNAKGVLPSFSCTQDTDCVGIDKLEAKLDQYNIDRLMPAALPASDWPTKRDEDELHPWDKENRSDWPAINFDAFLDQISTTPFAPYLTNGKNWGKKYYALNRWDEKKAIVTQLTLSPTEAKTAHKKLKALERFTFHPNLVKYVEHGFVPGDHDFSSPGSDDYYYIITKEPLENEKFLEHFSDQTNVKDLDFAKSARSMFSAIAKLHGANLIHGNINEHSVLIDMQTKLPVLADIVLDDNQNSITKTEYKRLHLNPDLTAARLQDIAQAIKFLYELAQRSGQSNDALLKLISESEDKKAASIVQLIDHFIDEQVPPLLDRIIKAVW